METDIFASTLAPLLAGIVSTVTMVVLLKSRSLPFDKPNERSLHIKPVPRSGGIAIITGIFAAALWLGANSGLLVPAVAVAIASDFDDRYTLPAAVRLLLHLLAAGVFLFLVMGNSRAAALFVLLLVITWTTNLYNFMDGADGLAGGMAVIGFGAYGWAASLAGNHELEMLAWSIAAATSGFLIFNFPPAKIFMGDVGSIPLGFLVGAIGVYGRQKEAWPLWFPVMVFAPFFVDASITLLRRIVRGERVWQPHRKHYYQRLILLGWSHRKTVLAEYALMLICSASAIVCLRTSLTARSVIIGVLTAVFAVAMWAIDRRWRQFSAGAPD